jgi:hypothetical protein
MMMMMMAIIIMMIMMLMMMAIIKMMMMIMMHKNCNLHITHYHHQYYHCRLYLIFQHITATISNSIIPGWSHSPSVEPLYNSTYHNNPCITLRVTSQFQSTVHLRQYNYAPAIITMNATIGLEVFLEE